MTMDQTDLSWPDDMLIDILVHLPIKSLMRFKCISKYWGNLIKSPTFLTRHIRRDCKETLLVKRYLPPTNCKKVRQLGGDDVMSFHDPDHSGKIESPSILVPFLDDVYAREQINLFGPCNGLVCLVSHDVVVLSNPALREFELVDPSPYACPEGYTALNCGSGFGFDANTSDYKIIQMWRIIEIMAGSHYQDFRIEINLYNSSTNAWRIIDVMVPQVTYDPGFDLLFNGACHWHASDYIEMMPITGILSFDVTNEVFRLFEFPNDWFDDDTSPGLVVLNQCLALVCYEMNELHVVDIWLMKEYGIKDSWTKEFVIGPYLFKCPFVCWRNGWLFVETSDCELAACALRENQIKRFQLHGYEGSFRALNYTESLITLSQVLICDKRN